MVEERVTDGERIGQLLASELTGLETGPLADVAVVDAAADADPSPDGTEAYGVAYRGDRVGRVVLFPDAVAMELDDGRVDGERVRSRGAAAGLDVRVGAAVVVRVESGAAVKRAVDALVAGLGDPGSGTQTDGRSGEE